MRDLFLNLYLDEDVHVVIADLVRDHGFAATTTREAHNLEASDADQLAFAAAHGMALLTHNRVDFERLAQQYFAEGRPHAGILIAVRRSPYAIAERLVHLMNALTADELLNQIIYL